MCVRPASGMCMSLLHAAAVADVVAWPGLLVVWILTVGGSDWLHRVSACAVLESLLWGQDPVAGAIVEKADDTAILRNSQAIQLDLLAPQVP